VHNGFVNVDSEKMSKSLGNFFTIRDVLRLYHPLALRWFLIGTHYRAGLNYTQRALEEVCLTSPGHSGCQLEYRCIAILAPFVLINLAWV
jgi:cysteinyl-tRNA synthetase